MGANTRDDRNSDKTWKDLFKKWGVPMVGPTAETVYPLDVHCPDCGAKPHERCDRRYEGEEHRGRIRMAGESNWVKSELRRLRAQNVDLRARLEKAADAWGVVRHLVAIPSDVVIDDNAMEVCATLQDALLKEIAEVSAGKVQATDADEIEPVALDKLVTDLIDHGAYFEERWLLTGVAADCRQAAIELRNLSRRIAYVRKTWAEFKRKHGVQQGWAGVAEIDGTLAEGGGGNDAPD